MDVTNLLLDGGDASLDEILAFVDSYDFNIATDAAIHIADRNSATEFLQDAEIEAILTGNQDDPIKNTLLDHSVDKSQTGEQHETRLATDTNLLEAPAIANSKALDSSRGHKGASSAELKWPMTPARERGRVRERVIHLREMVTQLERQLEVLNCHNDRARGTVREVPDYDEVKLSASHDENASSTSITVVSTSPGDGDIVMWRQLATRQYTARREAEKENASLRERLEEQIRVARRLEHLIRGQLPEHASASNPFTLSIE